ncbi:RluA family pseudouridine synthase [Rhodococcoides fascians]|uniref:RluA family pseudouridine synthase n=1 Tax=Rhodococcoides fascians TaxID=1828 RepID=UPI0018AF5A17|nr:RluA family pseudouridine synthase [Rhodococcus fascians]MBY4010507.1 RluA family pseudouridine synthase [Rhodococcus fascians]MBY4022962.1 RluA family pseudouridine synthase [Rhodococcus fascians]MDQ0280412.1 tRNA pseudouridine32 synthase/23S rRNA pseudouridine746 synthase [Rhodococcus fascians]
MRRRQQPPLAKRYGLDPARVRMPEDGSWPTVREFLTATEQRISPGRIDEMLAAGEVVDMGGPVSADAPYVPGDAVWFHRDLPMETVVPFDISIVHRDDAVLVIDKPHFLPTIPRGGHILQTALVRLRLELGLPQLVPAHRLDRVTAGLVLFVVDPSLRGAYQTLFQDRKVHKEYEAIAAYEPSLALPTEVRSRIVSDKGQFTACEVAGEPNAHTVVELLEHREGIGRYRLTPSTGRTHQLRLHMNSLGIPILGDDLYPTASGRAVDDFTAPLQLLASAIEFIDPISKAVRRFETQRSLERWV